MTAFSAVQQYSGWSLTARDPAAIERILPIWEWLYTHYFRVQTDGWEHIPDSQVLFVGSHNGGLASPDLPMFMVDWFRRYGLERTVYGLMHPGVWKIAPQLGQMGAKLGAIQAHPKMAFAAFQTGASVLVYPGGARDLFRPHRLRARIHLTGNTAFIKVALRQGVPIVPVISAGAHDTVVVLEDCYEQVKALHDRGLVPWLFNVDPEVFPIYLGLPWGLGVGPIPNLPLPIQIRTRVCSPIEFDRYGSAAARDRDYVQQCYKHVVNHMQRSLDNLIAAPLQNSLAAPQELQPASKSD
ncbi:MAG: lysophospholipid acyltransferase family protein [Cyanobacteria bacterium P01_E01_bin.34]